MRKDQLGVFSLRPTTDASAAYGYDGGLAAKFTGSIPEHWDRELGPTMFADFARDIAQRASAVRPLRVLDVTAGTGIVTRQLQDLSPPRHI